jgi:uncharacterized protein YaiL (DUF2058 family)
VEAVEVGNSLQDQLKRSGLVDDKQIRKAKQERHHKRRRGVPGDEVTDEARALARKAAAEKAERDRRLNLEREAEAEAKAVAAQVRQLIEMNRVPRGDADEPYNFADSKAVKRLYLSRAMHAQMTGGKLAIVRYGDGYEVIPAAVAEKIAARDEHCVVVRNDDDPSTKGDGYEDFKIPDDLMW